MQIWLILVQDKLLDFLAAMFGVSAKLEYWV